MQQPQQQQMRLRGGAKGPLRAALLASRRARHTQHRHAAAAALPRRSLLVRCSSALAAALPRRSLLVRCSSVLEPAAPAAPALQDDASAPAADAAPVPTYDDSDLEFAVPAEVSERNAALAERLRNKLVLAPLTKGGNLPFRRLCALYGAEVTMSEMAFAKPLLKGDRVERTRLLHAPEEKTYGFQVATKIITEGVEAAKLAHAAGASFFDINVGCPIYEASRRGLGAVMLRKPRSLAKLVHGVVLGSPLPVTVKIRTGEKDKSINVHRVTELLRRAGAAAVTVHGRTMEQRYRKPADWELVQQVAQARPELPIIGNGDVLTRFEAARRLSQPGVHAVMVGRGALIRPWIFQEVKQGAEMLPTAEERVGVYRHFSVLCKEHFGDDALGRRKAWYFLPWHFGFFHRYRPLPERVYGQASLEYPLMLTRTDLADPRVGEELGSLDLLERLLRCDNEAAHEEIAAVLWDTASDGEACQQLRALADGKLAAWEDESRQRGALEPGRGGGVGGGGGDSRGGRRKGGGEDEEW